MADAKLASRLTRLLLLVVLTAICVAGLTQLAAFFGRIVGSPRAVATFAAGEHAGRDPAGPPGRADAMAGAGMGGPGSVCPVTLLGQLLGAQMIAGHSSSAFGSGVGVSSVTPGGPVAEAGLMSGDVILSVSGTPVDCPVTALKAIHTTLGDAAPHAEAASEAILRVARDGVLIRVVLPATVLSPAAPTGTPSGDKPMASPPERQRRSR